LQPGFTPSCFMFLCPYGLLYSQHVQPATVYFNRMLSIPNEIMFQATRHALWLREVRRTRGHVRRLTSRVNRTLLRYLWIIMHHALVRIGNPRSAIQMRPPAGLRCFTMTNLLSGLQRHHIFVIRRFLSARRATYKQR
jgi:hypothetical protein